MRPPGRLAWATHGAGADGWIEADRRATIRVFAGDPPIRRLVRVTTTAPIPTRASHTFSFGNGTSRLRTLLGPGGRITASFVACARAHGFAGATVAARFATRIPDERLVSLHDVDKVDVRPGRASARCGSSSAVGG
jgi:hypothetical protein